MDIYLKKCIVGLILRFIWECWKQDLCWYQRPKAPSSITGRTYRDQIRNGVLAKVQHMVSLLFYGSAQWWSLVLNCVTGIDVPGSWIFPTIIAYGMSQWKGQVEASETILSMVGTVNQKQYWLDMTPKHKQQKKKQINSLARLKTFVFQKTLK